MIYFYPLYDCLRSPPPALNPGTTSASSLLTTQLGKASAECKLWNVSWLETNKYMKANVFFESLALLEGTGEERLHSSRVTSKSDPLVL